MARPEVEYRGHIIFWSDNSDAWGCHEMQNYNPSLAKVKAAIDRFYLKQRKAVAVPCYVLMSSDVIPATVIEFIKTTSKRSFGNTTHNNSFDHLVGVSHEASYTASGKPRKVRSEKVLGGLVPMTDEADTAIREWTRLKQIEAAAKDAADAAKILIPRMDLSHIPGLAALHDQENKRDK